MLDPIIICYKQYPVNITYNTLNHLATTAGYRPDYSGLKNAVLPNPE